MLRLTVSYGRREGRPEFSSESAECGLQVDLESSWLDDAVYLQERIKAAYAMCVEAVDVQLRPVVQAAPPPPPVQAPAPARQEPARNGNGNGNGGFGAPTTAKTFLGWFGKQEPTVKDAVKAVARARRLSSMYREWSDDDAKAVYSAVTAATS